MGGHTDAETLTEVSPGDFVVITGYPNGERSKWHVNEAPRIGGSGIGTRVPIVLQRADASEHWVTVFLKQQDDEWTIQRIMVFEGEPPRGMDAEEHGDDISVDRVSFEKAD